MPQNAGYGVSPAVLSIVYGAFHLTGIRYACTDILFDQRATPPNHFTFITGPSMSADIQATPFKGMHGPGKLEVILIGKLQQWS